MGTVVVTLHRGHSDAGLVGFVPLPEQLVTGVLFLEEEALAELGNPERLRLHLTSGDPQGDGQLRRIDYLRAARGPSALEAERELALAA